MNRDAHHRPTISNMGEMKYAYDIFISIHYAAINVNGLRKCSVIRNGKLKTKLYRVAFQPS